MTIVAEEEVLAAAELDLATGDLAVDTASVADASPAAEADGRQPFLVIEKGAPSDADIAALVCVFTAAAAAAAPADNGPQDLWGRPTMLHRGSSPFSPYSYPQLSNLRF
ncbi:acyl-CoA carboxylase subunit epsilon [Nocardia flavorosea]|uniref:Acyl-CoA carboxylase subunit epsilon n=1 Tax=Nocardia flavorosea TaxID=53429 RepID=A0A846YGI9_9NOCA|nr:acyl-CoA carboxylase subunit epsilon [Nocardia flavorosea]NKY56762.1 acyl-CoA carboxylase subunit epsilon [Nocardia flavorosea]